MASAAAGCSATALAATRPEQALEQLLACQRAEFMSPRLYAALQGPFGVELAGLDFMHPFDYANEVATLSAVHAALLDALAVPALVAAECVEQEASGRRPQDVLLSAILCKERRYLRQYAARVEAQHTAWHASGPPRLLVARHRAASAR